MAYAHNQHYRSDRAPGEPGGQGNPIICTLFVKRDYCTHHRGPWRLLWAESIDADTFIYAEGECSKKLFRTMGEAVAYGLRHYGETAARYPVHFD